MTLVLIDSSEIFTPDMPVELVVRGTIVYFMMLALLRVIPRRTTGSLGMMDLIFVVLIAEAAGRAMGRYDSIGDSVVLVATLVAWDYAINWLTYTIPVFEKLTSPSALLVVRDGQMLRRNMRAELLTEEELLRQLRLHGIDDLADVKRATVEADGSLSVTKYSEAK